MLEGYEFRQKRDDAKTAYFVSLLLNISGKSYKKSIKPQDILKPLYPDKPAKKQDLATDKEYFKQRFSLNEVD